MFFGYIDYDADALLGGGSLSFRLYRLWCGYSANCCLNCHKAAMVYSLRMHIPERCRFFAPYKGPNSAVILALTRNATCRFTVGGIIIRCVDGDGLILFVLRDLGRRQPPHIRRKWVPMVPTYAM